MLYRRGRSRMRPRPRPGGRNHSPCVFFFIYLFLREREGRGEQGEGQREGQRIPSRFRTVSTEPNMGLDPTNCEIVTRASQTQPTEPPRWPPKVHISKFAASQEMGKTGPPGAVLTPEGAHVPSLAGWASVRAVSPANYRELWGSHTRRQVLAGGTLPDPRSLSPQGRSGEPPFGAGGVQSGLGEAGVAQFWGRTIEDAPVLWARCLSPGPALPTAPCGCSQHPRRPQRGRTSSRMADRRRRTWATPTT